MIPVESRDASDEFECRKGMYGFLMSMKRKDGSFIMHVGGEVDVRYAFYDPDKSTADTEA